MTPDKIKKLEEIEKMLADCYMFDQNDNEMHWLIAELREAWEEIENLKDAFFDVLNQGCQDTEHTNKMSNGKLYFDSRCLSSYRSGLKYALKLGLIEKDQILR